MLPNRLQYREVVDTLLQNKPWCNDFLADSLLSEASHKLGNDYVDNYPDSACHYFLEANSIRQQIFHPTHRNLHRGYYMLSVAYQNRYKAVPSVQHRMWLDSARLYCDLIPPKDTLVYNLGRIEVLKVQLLAKEWHKIIALANEIELKQGANGSKMYIVWEIKAEALRETGALNNSIIAGRKALAKVQNAVLYDPVNATAYRRKIYWTLGNCWQDSLEHAQPETRKFVADSAVFYTLKALTMQNTTSEMVTLYGNLGEAYRRAGQVSKATQALEKGLAYQINAPGEIHDDRYAHLYLNLGEVYFYQKNISESLTAYEKALQKISGEQYSLNHLPPMQTIKGGATVQLTLLADISRSLLYQNTNESLLRASTVYDSLFVLLNIIRGEFSDDESKLDLARKSKQWLNKALEGYMRLYWLSTDVAAREQYLKRAFELTEQGKSFVLLEAARLKNATSGLPPEMLQKEQEVASAMTAAQADPSRQREADLLKGNYLMTLKQQYPAFYYLKYKGVDPDILPQTRAVLDTAQTLVTWYVADTVLYSFLIGPETFQADTTRITATQLKSMIQEFNQLLYRGKIEEEKQLADQGVQLYRLLIGQRSWQPNLTRRVILVPDQELNNLPFEALLTQSVEMGSAGIIPLAVQEQRFLLFKHDLSYCFSAAMLLEMQTSKRSAFDRRAAIFSPAGHELNASTEVNQIKNVLNDASLFPPQESTKAGFWEAARQYRMIHVASHGFLDANPDSCRIVFADAPLYLHELYSRQLEQEMVVFSACSTAKGTLNEGEGNISLARGLAYAGVKSLVCGMWDLPTEGKSVILPDFYKYLEAGYPKDVALAKAKRDYLLQHGQFPSPKNWSGIVLIGSVQPFERGMADMHWALLIISGLLVLAGIMVFRNRSGEKVLTV